jgi:hypothetical protein
MTPEQQKLIQQLKDAEAKLTPEQKLGLLRELNTLVGEMNKDVKEFLSSVKDSAS